MERQNAVWEAPTDTMDAPHAAGNFMLEVSPMADTKTIRIIKKTLDEMKAGENSRGG